MPLYEYQCDQCGDHFETIQKFSDQPLTIHEKCGGPVHRLLSAPAFHLKGSGWYATDYAKAGSSTANAKSDGKGEGGKSEGKSENGSGKSSSEKNSSEKAEKSSSSTKSDTSSATPAPAPSSSDKK